MPGIIPMKVIKVGTSAQSRIAQACDRCRSKKIRCDGVTPCCSQCANVGFECKTSDKLSRRAFPRGYTESLEDRVRALELEVRELKDLLDEKDEKIDLLSRIHSFSPLRRSSTTPSEETKPYATPAKEDVIKMQQAPLLLDSDAESDSYFMGASSGRAFVDVFKLKLQETGKSSSGFNTNDFCNPTKRAAPSPAMSGHVTMKVPPRLLSDQMINVFFQEWAPLFPVLHRPTFLKLYAEFVADPDSIRDQQAIAQLYLVFGIAALSNELNTQDVVEFEAQWKPALNSIISNSTFTTLQCLVLAQIHCITNSDYDSLLYYKGVAVALSLRLGLHQSQKRFSVGALTRETRKKVFWTQYTLDCFSATVMGLPKLLKDDEIYCEYPADVDDENVTERGFQPSLPGESTKLSSALALFRGARVLSKVLLELYPADTSHETTLQKILALSDELDAWHDELPAHLRLQFVQDKPSTNVISSRSPLLSLTYYYIRSLIHRPVVGATLGAKTSSSVVALADSGKHIMQIFQLLEERSMSFSFCLNKNEVLLLSGFGLLFQGLDLKQDGKLIRENQRLVCSVIQNLERNMAPAALPFKKLACSIIAIERFAKTAPLCKLDDSSKVDPTSRRSSGGSMSAPQVTAKSTKKQLQSIASLFSFGGSKASREPQPETSRRSKAAPAPLNRNLALYARHSTINLPVVRPALEHKRSSSDSRPTVSTYLPNLDYLPFGDNSAIPPRSARSDNAKPASAPTDWDHLFGYVDDGPGVEITQEYSYDSSSIDYENNLNDISPDVLSSYTDMNRSTSANIHDWSPEAWAVQGSFEELSQTAQSVFSLSEESLTSGEELSSCDYGGVGTEYRGIIIPNLVEDWGVDSGLEFGRSVSG